MPGAMWETSGRNLRRLPVALQGKGTGWVSQKAKRDGRARVRLAKAGLRAPSTRLQPQQFRSTVVSPSYETQKAVLWARIHHVVF